MEQAEKRAEAERDYASLVVKVSGRDALPVRAIPYVSGWALSPDMVAQNFARAATEGFEKLESTDTYHLGDGGPVKLLPKEWDRPIAALQGLQAQLKEEYTSDERGYAAWVSRSVEKLPARVFVWLDEFVADFELDHGPNRLSITSEREGDRALNLSPFLDEEELNMVLEGFGRKSELRTRRSDDFHAHFAEMAWNGRLIDWQYWVQNMPTLNAAEASRLMAGLDPDLYEDLTSRPEPKNNPAQVCAEARRMERLAVAEGRDRMPPEGWYQWARERDFDPHIGFFLAVYGRHLRENELQVLREMPRAEATRWEQARVISDVGREVSTSYARHIGSMSMTFPRFVAEVEERLARWRRGRYELVEAAQVLADHAGGLDAKELAEQMDAAIRDGKLTYRVNNIRVEPQRIPREHLWYRTIFQHDVNAWLAAEAIGDALRLEYPYPPTKADKAAVHALGSEPARIAAPLVEHAEQPGWHLNTPQRFRGYSWPLYKFLKTAHSAGAAKPTARDVLDAFRATKPPEVDQVNADGLIYSDTEGKAKEATLAAIAEMIRRMTSEDA
ncbi:hypothetical protein [Roseateles sp. P5_D6]